MRLHGLKLVLVVVGLLPLASCKKAPSVDWGQAVQWTQDTQDALSLMVDPKRRSLSDEVFLDHSGMCPELKAAEAMPDKSDFESHDREEAIEKARVTCVTRIRAKAGAQPRLAKVTVPLSELTRFKYDFERKGYVVVVSAALDTDEKFIKEKELTPGSLVLTMTHTFENPDGPVDTSLQTFIEFRGAAGFWNKGELFFPMAEDAAKAAAPRLEFTKKNSHPLAALEKRPQALELAFEPGDPFLAAFGISAIPAKLLGVRIVDEKGPIFPALTVPAQ